MNLLELVGRVVHVGRDARRGGVYCLAGAVAQGVVSVVFLLGYVAVLHLDQTVEVVVLIAVGDGAAVHRLGLCAAVAYAVVGIDVAAEGGGAGLVGEAG